MNAFRFEPDDQHPRLHLTGDVTIQHVRELHALLLPGLGRQHTLTIDASAVARIDAAVLQLLLAAARVTATTQVLAPSAGWQAALHRFGLDPASFTSVPPSSVSHA